METTLFETTASVAETIATVESGIGFTPENLAETAPIMGKGMLGIFIVMGIIIICVAFLNYVGSPERKRERETRKQAKAEAGNINSNSNINK